MQRTPAGFPSGIPGMTEEIEGAMQQAPHPVRHGRMFLSAVLIHSGSMVAIKGKGLQLVPMMFGLFKRLDRAQRHTVVMGLQHDLLAAFLVEFENAQEDPHHMFHRVMIVIMQQDLIARNMHLSADRAIRNRPGPWSGEVRPSGSVLLGKFWCGPGPGSPNAGQ